MSTSAARAWRGAVVVLGAALAAGSSRVGAQDPDASLDALRREYGDKQKKYEALAKKAAQAIDEALDARRWKDAAGERPLSEHPWVVLAAELAARARTASSGKPNARVAGLLERFPWGERLQLDLGLDGGSSRPIPAHENGFIHLGAPPAPMPGFPDLYVNHYLYGTRELVGWQYAVAGERGLRFGGRGPKQAAEAAERLPAWEELRVGLSGYPAEVVLLGLPGLVHAIHERLAERRAEGTAEPPLVDELMAFLDSKWNGFTFEPPWSDERVPFVVPPHRLYTDSRGFVDRFETGSRLAGVGDVPFVALPTYVEYAERFMGVKIHTGAFVAETVQAKEVLERFRRESTYLARYEMLVELISRAVLLPDQAYPRYLVAYDFPGGRIPAGRAQDATLDVPRLHAVLLWAHSGKDPVALADFLHEHLLSREENRFPSDVSLPIQLTWLARDRRAELLEGIAARCREGRGPDGEPSTYELEFSPHATYLDPSGELAAEHVLASFQGFHAPVTAAIREAAGAVVGKVVD